MVSIATDSQRITSSDRLLTYEPQTREPNIGNAERVVTGIIGGILAARAIAHPTLPRLLLGAIGGGLLYRASSGYCPTYDRLKIDNARTGPARPQDYYKNGIHVEMAYTIMRPAGELYDFWRDFENLPKFMEHLQSVKKIDDRTSRWAARGPAGTSVEWDAEIINEEPGKLIAWRSLANANVDNAGSVRFGSSPGDRGTEVRVEIEYIPPAGEIGRAVAWLYGEEPRQQIQEDLRRFKQLMETGEIPSTQGQSRGQCGFGT